MTPRVRRLISDGPPPVDLALRDGLNVVLADETRTAELVSAWRATLSGLDVGLRVRAVVNGSVTELPRHMFAEGFLGNPETAIVDRTRFASVATPGGILDVSVVEERADLANAAADRAAATLRSAEDRLAALEIIAERSLAAVDSGSPVDERGVSEGFAPPSIEVNPAKLAAIRVVPSRLDAEADHDRARRHPTLIGFARVYVGEVEAILGRRRALIEEMVQLGLSALPTLEPVRRQLAALTPQMTLDPQAVELSERWNQMSARRADVQASGLGEVARGLTERVNAARAEYDSAMLEAERSGTGGGGMSVIDRALFAALDDQSTRAVDRTEAAKALKRDLLEGPGPLMDWGEQRVPNAGQKLAVAEVELGKVTRELADVEARRAQNGEGDLAGAEDEVRRDVVGFLGEDPGAHTVLALSSCRILPAIPGALRTEVVAKIDEMEHAIVDAASRREAAEAALIEASARRAQARSEAIRAIAALEAHRRETDMARNSLERAEAARSQALAEVMRAVEQSNELGPDISLIGVLLHELGRRPTGSPVFFDDALCDAPQLERESALTELAERSIDRVVVYLTRDRDVAGWAGDNGVNVDRL